MESMSSNEEQRLTSLEEAQHIVERARQRPHRLNVPPTPYNLLKLRVSGDPDLETLLYELTEQHGQEGALERWETAVEKLEEE